MSRSRIRTIPSSIPKNEKFHIVCRASKINAGDKKKYGLDGLSYNKSILPKGAGSVSRFNANGKYILLKDEPKEQRYIRTIEWSWEQWAAGGGTETHTDFKDIYRECYKRKHVLPPSLTISLQKIGGTDYYCLECLDTSVNNEDEVKVGINLFLEIFGEYEVSVDGNLLKAKVEVLSWRLLPPGEHPFEKLEKHIQEIVGKSPRVLPVIEDRQKFMNDLGPDSIFVGLGGFSTYAAYKFGKLVVLESIKLDNALYVFDKNWRDVSRLTKKEIIQGKLALKRIVHTQGWKKILKKTLGIK